WLPSPLYDADPPREGTEMMPTCVRRSLLAFVAVMAFATALAFAPARAAPTQDDLAAVALTAREIGTGFTVAPKGPVDQLTPLGLTNYSVVFQRSGLRGIDLVAVVLIDGDDAGIEADNPLGDLKDLGITLSPATPPAIGSDTTMQTVSGNVVGVSVSGEIIRWRHGNITAYVAALGTS